MPTVGTRSAKIRWPTPTPWQIRVRHFSGAAGIKELLRIKRGDNDSCVWQGERSSALKRGNWNCTVFSSFKLTSTPDAFFIEEAVRALEGERVFFERENKATVPRDLM